MMKNNIFKIFLVVIGMGLFSSMLMAQSQEKKCQLKANPFLEFNLLAPVWNYSSSQSGNGIFVPYYYSPVDYGITTGLRITFRPWYHTGIITGYERINNSTYLPLKWRNSLQFSLKNQIIHIHLDATYDFGLLDQYQLNSVGGPGVELSAGWSKMLGNTVQLEYKLGFRKQRVVFKSEPQDGHRYDYIYNFSYLVTGLNLSF